MLLKRACCRLRHVASFPASPSFRAIIPCMTFDPPEGKAEREPGRFCHMTSVTLRHPYIRYRRGQTASMSLYWIGLRLRACEIPSSGTGSMEEQAGLSSSIANVWVTWHDAGHVTKSPRLSLRFSFGWVKGHSWNYCS